MKEGFKRWRNAKDQKPNTKKPHEKNDSTTDSSLFLNGTVTFSGPFLQLCLYHWTTLTAHSSSSSLRTYLSKKENVFSWESSFTVVQKIRPVKKVLICFEMQTHNNIKYIYCIYILYIRQCKMYLTSNLNMFGVYYYPWHTNILEEASSEIQD